MEPLLKIKNLSKKYSNEKIFGFSNTDNTHAVNSVNFEIYKGKTLGLVGESGSGKSTIGKSILRLTEPTEGEVFFNGMNILDLSKEKMRFLRKEMQIIFQDPYLTLNPKLKIKTILEEPLRIHKLYKSESEIKNKINNLLDHIRLSKNSLNKYPHEFSGGQRQRISIARALACEPQFIVCDECVSALDVSIQAQILNLLKDLQKELKLTYLFISHNLNVVRSISHNIAIIYLGKIIEQGPTEEIFKNPKERYTKTLLSSILNIG